MRNLLLETREVLEKAGLELCDVQYVRRYDDTSKEMVYYKVNYSDLARLLDTEYDNGYGCAEIDQSLMLIGEYWWLERHEYDGSEWWEYKEKPRKPKDQIWGNVHTLTPEMINKELMSDDDD